MLLEATWELLEKWFRENRSSMKEYGELRMWTEILDELGGSFVRIWPSFVRQCKTSSGSQRGLRTDYDVGNVTLAERRPWWYNLFVNKENEEESSDVRKDFAEAAVSLGDGPCREEG